MTSQAPSASPPIGTKPASQKPALLSWLPTIILNIVLPIVTYFFLTTLAHVQDIPALLISGVWPALQLLHTIWRQRHIDEISVFILILTAIGVLLTVTSQDARAVFLRDWGVYGLLGLAILASALFPRPLMFYVGRRFATDGSKAQRDWWNGLWRYPHFRRGQRILNFVWGIVLFAEAVAGVILTISLGTEAMVLIDNVLPYIVLAGLIFGTIIYGRRAREAAARRAGAAAVPPVGDS